MRKKMVNKSGFFKTEEFHRAPEEIAKGVLRMSSVMVGNTNVPVSSVLGVQIKGDDFIYMFEKPAKEGV